MEIRFFFTLETYFGVLINFLVYWSVIFVLLWLLGHDHLMLEFASLLLRYLLLVCGIFEVLVCRQVETLIFFYLRQRLNFYVRIVPRFGCIA